jgi:CDP-glucose 4,6-dehydratase
MLNAKVFGYSLPPPTQPNLFELSNIGDRIDFVFADIRNLDKLKSEMIKFSPDIVIHMAAQPLVRYSYLHPVETYSTNVMGTVNLFEAVRCTPSVRVVINVTTDKCYENKEWLWGYRENDTLGGNDPYSSSKACSELVTSAYRSSYFENSKYNEHRVSISTVRAGNVIGGGDWAKDRLVPDLLSAFIDKRIATIRNPNSIRPWQHVLEPLRGYLSLSEKMFESGCNYSQEWNFGPNDDDSWTVKHLADTLGSLWGSDASLKIDSPSNLHEANQLKLDTSKVRKLIDWTPKLKLEQSLSLVVEWTKQWQATGDASAITRYQIQNYQDSFFN